MYENVRVLAHSSIRIEGSRTLYFDPYQVTEEYQDADIVFVTHEHFDHFSPEDIKKVSKDGTLLVMPANMDGFESQTCLTEYRLLKAGDSAEINGIKVEAVAAYNLGRPFHTKDTGNIGYLVTMDDTTYYVAGDTDMTEENRKVKCDVALVPVGGTYTMDYKQAAELVNGIKPKLAIPTHYGAVAGSSEDGGKFAALVEKPVEVRIML